MNDPMTQAAIIGTVTSIITEFAKYIPFINTNSFTRSLTAIVLLIIGSFITAGGFTWEKFLESVVFSLTAYKVVVQPTADATAMKTQK